MKQIELPSGLSVVTSFDKKRREPVDYKRAIAAAQVLQEEQAKREINQTSANIKITTNDPINLVFHGDQHIGSVATNYSELLRQTDTIRTTRNTFLALTGDLIDNAFIFREGGHTNNLTYDMQGEIAINMMQDLSEAGKVLWEVTGNHQGFQQNFAKAYQDELRYPVLTNHGSVNLTVGKQDYDIFGFHKLSMGSSTMSPFLRCQRALEYYDGDLDIAVGGHTHRKGIAQYKLGIDNHQKLRTMIETGTFKPEERWQREQGNLRMSQFDVGGAGVILYPDQNRVIPYYDFDQGQDLMNGLTGMRSILNATTSNILRGK